MPVAFRELLCDSAQRARSLLALAAFESAIMVAIEVLEQQLAQLATRARAFGVSDATKQHDDCENDELHARTTRGHA